MARHRYVVTAVGLLVSAVFIYLAVRGLDLAAIEDAFSHSELLPWLPLGVASYLLSHVARGVRCRLLVRRHAAIGLSTATHVVVVGYAANNVLPARLGELVRSGMLAERAAMPLAQSIAVTFIERVLDGLTLLFLLVVATLTVDVAGWMRELVYVALAVFGAAAVAMLVAARWPRVLVALAAGLGRPLGPRWRDRFAGLATSVTDAGACLRDPLDAALLGCSSLVVWCFEAGMYVALLPIFGIEVTWQLAVATMCVTGFGLLLPSSPGSIGPYHYFASQAMIVFGVAAPTALAYATLVHLAFYIPVTIWGAAAMAWYGVELNAAAALAGEPRPGAAAAALPAPGTGAAREPRV